MMHRGQMISIIFILLFPLSGCVLDGSDLLDAGAEADAQDDTGQSALMWAIQEGHTCVVPDLLEFSADVNIKSDTGVTALMYAAKQGDPEVVRNLLEAGTEIHVTADDGRTALEWAMEEGHGESAKFSRKRRPSNDRKI